MTLLLAPAGLLGAALPGVALLPPESAWAERLQAPLLTADDRLARAAGLRCRVVVVTP